MLSEMLFAISIVALSQFALYYWRAVLSGVASQPVSERVLAAAQVQDGRLTAKHFQTLAGLHELTPDLRPHRGGLGISILSTPQGVMSDSDARAKNVGGEVLCRVF